MLIWYGQHRRGKDTQMTRYERQPGRTDLPVVPVAIVNPLPEVTEEDEVAEEDLAEVTTDEEAATD